MAHWSERFLAARYRAGADGPHEYDCWSFLRWVQREQFDVEIPFMPSPDNIRATMKAMPVWAREFGWAPVDRPQHGDVAFMSILRNPSHVGVYVGDLREPLILHCAAPAASLVPVARLTSLQWRVHAYYRRA